MPRRLLAAIMFTDLVGFTKLMGEDELQAKSIRDRHRSILKDAINRNEGEILQYYGDGTLSIFNSAISAVNAAKEIQVGMMDSPIIPLRIGIHSGDVVKDSEGIYGDGVNVASRIESLAIPGSVLISDKVYDDIKNHKSITSRLLGSFELKNVDQPVNVYAITNSPLAVPKREEVRGKTKENFKTIAVLPFVNMSADPDNEYFSDGITEEILNALAKIDGLRVTARTSAFAFKGQDVDVRQIGDQLNVATVLEGSVRKSGSMVRITAQLINAVDGYHLWSETYDRELQNIFAVQDEISSTIARQLHEKLALKVEKTQSTEKQINTEAYNLYLKGNYFFYKWSPESVKKSIPFYQQAIEIQKDFVLGYTGMAAAYLFLGASGQAEPGKSLAKAEEAASQAMILDANQEMTHVTFAMVNFLHLKDYEAADRYFLKALKINPNSSVALNYYTMFLLTRKKIDLAGKHIQRAEVLDPLSPLILNSKADVFFCAGDYEASLEAINKCLEIDPHFRSAAESKGWVYLCMDKPDLALEAFKKYHDMTDSPDKGIAGLGYTYAIMGNRAKALELIGRLEQRQIKEKQLALQVDFMVIYTGLGEFDKVYQYAQEALKKGLAFFYLEIHPMWRPMLEIEKFRKLFQQYGYLLD